MDRGVSADVIVFKSLCRDVGIGANSYSLEVGGTRMVLDAGMHPKEEGLEAQPRYELIGDDTAEAINARNLLLGLRPLREPVARPEGGEKGVGQ